MVRVRDFYPSSLEFGSEAHQTLCALPRLHHPSLFSLQPPCRFRKVQLQISQTKTTLALFYSTAGNKQFDDGESSQKALPLWQHNKWEAIIAFATAVLILIAAATVVRLDPLL